MSRLVKAISLFLVATRFGVSATPGEIRCSAYKFSLQAPSGWRVAVDKGGLPLFANFSWSRLKAQAILPVGGATINVIAWDRIPRRPGDDTLDGWAELDEVNAIPGTIVTQRLNVPTSGAITAGLMTDYDLQVFGPDGQRQHEVSAYWTFREQRFAAHLYYIIGDPKSSDYSRTVAALVRSIRAL